MAPRRKNRTTGPKTSQSSLSSGTRSTDAVRRISLPGGEVVEVPARAVDVLVAEISQETLIQAHRGPLPAPDDLKRYGEIVPDGVERIVRMAESSLEHSQTMDRAESKRRDRVVWIAGLSQTLGTLFAGGFAFGSLVAMYLLASDGKWGEGIATLVVAVLSLLLGQRQSKLGAKRSENKD